DDEPFKDLIYSSPARGLGRVSAPRRSRKPQQFRRQVVGASLPLSEGILLDPFMGSGWTVAAASACGLSSIGLGIQTEYFALATTAIPKLAELEINAPTGNDSKRRL